MIQRHRRPDGTNLDRDLGPGRVSLPVKAVQLTDAIPGKHLGVNPAKPGHTEYVKEWHRRTGR